MTEPGRQEATTVPEGLAKSVLYHQTTQEAAKKILESGFQRGLRGAGSDGPLRGIFLKETPDILVGGGIAQAQLEVELDPDVKLLDLRSDAPASFVRLPFGSDNVGEQDFALAGWLERNGHEELSREYQDAINKLHKETPNPEFLNALWPRIELLLQGQGYGGIKYLDTYLRGENKGKVFSSVVIFDPKNLTARSIS